MEDMQDIRCIADADRREKGAAAGLQAASHGSNPKSFFDTIVETANALERCRLPPQSRRKAITFLTSAVIGGCLGPNLAQARPPLVRDRLMRAFASDARNDAPVYNKAPSSNAPTQGGAQPPPRTPDYQPWPPAAPSARYTYLPSFMARYVNKSMAELFDPFEARLLDAGYRNVHYFDAPNTVALATRFEKIDEEARPIIKGRFDLNVKFPLDAGDYQSRLVNARIGRYRAFVFFLTDDRARSDPTPSNFAKQRKFLCAGQRFLEDSLKGRTINGNHQFLSFAYEYCVFKSGDPRFVRESRWQGEHHLIQSHLEPGK